MALHLCLVGVLLLASYWPIEKIGVDSDSLPAETSLYLLASNTIPDLAPAAGPARARVQPALKERRPLKKRRAKPVVAATAKIDAPAPAQPTLEPSDDGVEVEAPASAAAGLGGTGRGSLGPIVAPKALGDYAVLKIPFTKEATRKKLRGAIRVRIQLDASGTVRSVSLISGVGHGMDQRALDLARKFRFRPARNGFGHAVSCIIDWTFHL